MGNTWRRPLGPDVFPALSLRQPWAWAVLHAGKSIENRRWSTKFRGEFLIHAAKGLGRQEYIEARGAIEDVLDESYGSTLSREGVPPMQLLERGGFVGVANLVDVLPPCRGLFRCAFRWHMPEQYGFVLGHIRRVDFTPHKGALGFFGVPSDIARNVLATTMAV